MNCLKDLSTLLFVTALMPFVVSAFLMGRTGKSKNSKALKPSGEISFKGTLPKLNIVHKHGSLVLECEAQAVPPPTIHWLKNGVRIPMGLTELAEDDAATYEDQQKGSDKQVLGVASTRSRLSLDCVTGRDHAIYTCVAETPYLKATQETTVRVVKQQESIPEEVTQCVGRRQSRMSPAAIHMWTVTRLELEGTTVQLFCRARGYPEPTITWYDRTNKPIVEGDDYQILDNGDLVISVISWRKNMGLYTCMADNGVGTDTSTTFLYPAARD